MKYIHNFRREIIHWLILSPSDPREPEQEHLDKTLLFLWKSIDHLEDGRLVASGHSFAVVPIYRLRAWGE